MSPLRYPYVASTRLRKNHSIYFLKSLIVKKNIVCFPMFFYLYVASTRLRKYSFNFLNALMVNRMNVSHRHGISKKTIQLLLST